MAAQTASINRLTDALSHIFREMSESNAIARENREKLQTFMTDVGKSMKDMSKSTLTAMADIKTIVETISENHSEVEPPNIFTSTVTQHNNNTASQKHQNSEVTPQNQTGNSTLEQSITRLHSCIEKNMRNERNYKRDYTLTENSNIEIWLDSLHSELSEKNLVQLLTEDNVLRDDQTGNTNRDKKTVRDIIINHINDYYHQKIVHIREPSEIIKEIREIRRVDTNMTETNIRQKLYNLKKFRGEKVNNFIEKFEKILRQFESCNPNKTIAEDEKRALFFHAVSDAHPELVTASLGRTRAEGEMSTNDMKTFLLQHEAQTQKIPEAKAVNIQRTNIPRQSSSEKDISHIKCYRCNKQGHYQTDCPLKEFKMWFCYTCNRVEHHKGEECPNAVQRYDNNKNTNYTVGNTGKDKGGFRDKQRNFRENKPYQKQGNNNTGKKGVANKTGKHLNNFSDDSNIKFIADSGSTEHIINRGLILRDYTKSTNEEIRSANREESANIKIDGRENLFLKSRENDNILHLSNIIHAENIADNLLSLRKFAEAGCGIYLDDSELRIFDKKSENLVTGHYEKPNWIVDFRVQDMDSEENKYEKYVVRAQLVSLEDFLTQSQTDHQTETQNTENTDETTSEIGRENVQETTIEPEPSIAEVNLKWKILDLNNPLSEAEAEKLNGKFYRETTEINKYKPSEGMLLHWRLGHTSLDYMKHLQKHEEKLKKVKFDREILDCEICILAKMESLPFKNNRSRSDRPLHTIHVDTMGKITPASFPGENRFIVVLVDDHTRYARAYCVNHKSESGDCLERFLTHMRNLLGKNEKVCYIRGDNGTEFTGGKFSEIMKKEGISSDFAPPYTPELNGTAERFNKTIQKIMRALMIESGLPKTMWVLAVEAAVHIYNRTPHKGIEFKTPLQMINPNKNSHLDELKRFGCLAYIKVPIPENKFSVRAIKGILVGYTPTGYLIWQPQTQRFMNSRHVRFNEKVLYRDISGASKQPEIEIENFRLNIDEESTEKQEAQLPEETDTNEKFEPKRGRPAKRKMIDGKQTSKIRENPKRKAKANPLRDPNFVYKTQEAQVEENNENSEDEIYYARMASINRDPISYSEAINSEYREEWKEAIREELKAMKDNNVWEILDKPEKTSESKNMNIIDSRWIFKRKTQENGSEKFKARLVIRGFKDKNTYELSETYAPVSRLPVIRSALSVINKYDLEVHQLDVKTAFLNGILEDEVFMEIPEGLEIDRKSKMCKLRKTLYGLKTSPKRWNIRFSEEADKLGL